MYILTEGGSGIISQNRGREEGGDPSEAKLKIFIEPSQHSVWEGIIPRRRGGGGVVKILRSSSICQRLRSSSIFKNEWGRGVKHVQSQTNIHNIETESIREAAINISRGGVPQSCGLRPRSTAPPLIYQPNLYTPSEKSDFPLDPP